MIAFRVLAALALTIGTAATAAADPVVTVPHSFTVADGDVAGSSVPVSVRLLAGRDGAVYGTRDLGDRAGGSVFRLAPPISSASGWSYSTIYHFPSTVRPGGPILQDGSGRLFGTTTAPSGSTSFYRLQRPAQGGGGWVSTPIYTLSGRTGFVEAQDAMGRLYCEAETPVGSADPSRLAIFQLSPPTAGGTAYTPRTLFSKAGLRSYTSPLLLRYRPAGAIDLYGLADATGNDLPSLAFRLSSPAHDNAAWIFTTLHQFHQFDVGGYLPASLSADRSLNLYGFNYGGGSANDNGVPEGGVFRIEPPQGAQSAWTERSLYQFHYGTIIDGHCSGAAFSCGNNVSGLIEGPNGALYVSSFDSHAGDHYGAVQGPGVIFSLTPVSAGGDTTPWDVKVQHQFTTTDPAGQGPGAFVRIADAKGRVSFVGVTSSGGANGLGTVFQFTP